jgi:hypothetical protein
MEEMTGDADLGHMTEAQRACEKGQSYLGRDRQ